MALRLRCAAFVVLAAVLKLATPADADTDGLLLPLARPGVWPGVSQLIAFDGRIWFANSAPFADTNAADIYSYDPQTGLLRYERGLFTQDAGAPAVAGGKLFWPFEDPRFGVGAGEFAVTDGQFWHWRRLPQGSAMHLHAMGACGGELVAVTGGWEGQLQISRDGGTTWRLAATYPKGEASFTRLVAIASFRGRCFIGASASGGHGRKLLEWTHGRLVAVPGWPEADRTDGFTVHDGRLFAWNDNAKTRSLFAFDGETAVPVSVPPSGRLNGLTSDGAYIWAVSRDGSAGALWRSRDGSAWTEIQRFEEAPISVTATEGAVFVGTHRGDGGALWGPPVVSAPLGDSATAFEAQNPHPAGTADMTGASGIESLVFGESDIDADFDSLRTAFQRLSGIPDPALGWHLAALFPNVALEGRERMFTGERVAKTDLARWYMLGAMAVNGHGRVPPDLLCVPLPGRQNAAEKYFDLPIAAIATVGWIGQDDQETIAALIRRLDEEQDPKWLRADIVAALAALTGEPFGHDVARWRAWGNGR
jgi:hypothetical protein